MDFIHGKKDPWGMVVNPTYKNITVPTAIWPLLDTYVPKTDITCLQENPSVYFSQIAAPVSTLRKIAEALLDAWPNVQTRCDFDTSTDLFKLGRIDRQSFGARFMLGIVSLGDAKRYGLRDAALETKAGQYVAPDQRSLAAAVALGRQSARYAPFVIDQGAVRKSGEAYPGTMVVYTAARLRNLPQGDADKVAQFIRVSTTEGQRPGSGNGDLPDGFLPIQTTGVTAKLYDSAQEVAAAVEAQKEPRSEQTGGSTGSGTGTGTGLGAGTGVTGPVSSFDPPGDADPSSARGPSAAPSVPTAATPMPDTQPVGSTIAGGLLPLLILLGAIGCVAATALRLTLPALRRRG
jgi:hypothetical protein